MQTLFSRSPWERASVVPIRGAMLGQTSPNCEPTPEGGQRCADGTYYPPGCKPGSGSGIPAAAPTPGANVPLIIGGVAAAAAAGYLLLSGHRHRLAAEPTALESYSEAVSQLNSIADKINTERSNDAFYFGKYIEASKHRQDLVLAEGPAQKNLTQQEQIWNTNHLNADAYQAAQAAFDQIEADKGAAVQAMQENRDGINMAAQNVMTYRNNAEAIVSQLPTEIQAQAWRIIDPCSLRAPTSMEGRRLGQFYSWNSGGDQSGHDPYANPYGMTPEQRLLRTNDMNPQLTQATYTCSYGDDVRRGVDSTTMAVLKAQGYTCQQDSSGYTNSYGGASSSMVAVNPGGTSGMMMRGRYPIVNSR